MLQNKCPVESGWASSSATLESASLTVQCLCLFAVVRHITLKVAVNENPVTF